MYAEERQQAHGPAGRPAGPAVGRPARRHVRRHHRDRPPRPLRRWSVSDSSAACTEVRCPSSSLSVIESALGERDQANIAAKDAHRDGRARAAARRPAVGRDHRRRHDHGPARRPCSPREHRLTRRHPRRPGRRPARRAPPHRAAPAARPGPARPPRPRSATTPSPRSASSAPTSPSSAPTGSPPTTGSPRPTTTRPRPSGPSWLRAAHRRARATPPRSASRPRCRFAVARRGRRVVTDAGIDRTSTARALEQAGLEVVVA